MKVTIDVPDSFFKDASFGSIDPEREVKYILAAKMVESGRISTGKAAEWLNISKPRFLQEISRYGLSAFPVNEETLDKDILNAQDDYI